MLSTGLLMNERTGTRCGFIFRARLLERFSYCFACHLRMPSLAAGCWLLDVRGVYSNIVRGQE
jgi:hypothetical protein